MFFLNRCCQESFPLLGVIPPHLPKMPSNTADLWTFCGGSSDSNPVLVFCVFASNVLIYQNECVFSCGHSQWPFVKFHRHRVCLVDCVGLICSLYSWWEGFGFSSLATLCLDFSCGFISIFARGSSTGVCSWGCPGGLGSAPVRARCGGGAAAWSAPGTQGSWWLGQQEI